MNIRILTFEAARLALRLLDADAESLVESTLSAMLSDVSSGPLDAEMPTISLQFDSGLWKIHDQQCDLKYAVEEPGDAIYYLTDRIVFHIADKAQEVHCLHAAAVSTEGMALVIPANSGAGKSSFCAWLTANGFNYLSDELVLLEASGDVTGFPRPIQIKPRGFSAISSLLSEPELVFKGNAASAVSVESLTGRKTEKMLNQGQEKPRLAAFIFPKYQQDSGFEFDRLPSAEAGLALMGCHVNFRNLHGGSFKELMQLVRTTPCFSLTYGGFSELPDDFTNSLKNMLKA